MVVLVTRTGLKYWNGIIIVIVSMAVLDHYDHHGGMNNLHLTTRTEQRLRLEVALGLALPCVFLQTLILLWRPELDGQRHELGIGKSNMKFCLLEPLLARMNSLLVCNLYNALYEVSDVYWFMSFGTCYDVVI